MRMISLGRIGGLYRAVAEAVPAGCEVLDAGCGTGGVTAALLDRGCTVTGVDRSDAMLEIAERKLHEPITQGRLRLRQLNLVRLSAEFAEASFDTAVCCLVFSELSRTEQGYLLEQLGGLVRPGGTVVVADEITPRSLPARLAHRAGRAPLAALTYLVTQTGTRPVNELARLMADSGLEEITASTPGPAFQITSGRRPACRLAPRQ
jgi:demethylmenaquinone methyltransferase/2-methoxy-6-polyprenyl-1,4-benzoquinol methylase